MTAIIKDASMTNQNGVGMLWNIGYDESRRKVTTNGWSMINPVFLLKKPVYRIIPLSPANREKSGTDQAGRTLTAGKKLLGDRTSQLEDRQVHRYHHESNNTTQNDHNDRFERISQILDCLVNLSIVEIRNL